jgi:heme/copper-type cytochrome/quinol oxidase subunit 2
MSKFVKRLAMVLTVSVPIIVGIFFLPSIMQQRFFNQTKIMEKANNTIKEIHIFSEQYMFSPMYIRLKKGRKIRLVLTTNDVQHGIFLPDLKINLSAYPGKPAETVIIPDKKGEFTVVCSLYCGVDHNKMMMTFAVEE